jgi:hypothetical protein
MSGYQRDKYLLILQKNFDYPWVDRCFGALHIIYRSRQSTVNLSLDGYVVKAGTIDMQTNRQHYSMFMSLDRSVVPPIVTLIVAIVILLLIILLPMEVI